MHPALAKKRLGQALAVKPLSAVFAGYAATTPLAHALYRTAEANHLSQAELLRPVLDLGCGSCEFAQLALRSNVDVGIDVSLRRLFQRDPRYGNVCQGDAGRLPLDEDAFQTVLCVSVLEHLHQPQRALAEVYRVLKPGGCFVGTATLVDMHAQLFYPRLLRWLGLSRLYLRLHDWAFEHRCLLTQVQWVKMFTDCGLELVVCRKIVSPRLTRYWDMLLAFAWPYRILPRWVYSLMFRPPGVRVLVQRWLLPLCFAEESDGSSLFFVARKPEEAQ